VAKFFNFVLEFNFKKVISKFFFFDELPISSLFFKNKIVFLFFYFFSVKNNNYKKYFFLNYKNNRFFKKAEQIKQKNLYKTESNKFFFYKNFFEGFKYIFLATRFWFLPLFSFFFLSFFLCFMKVIPFYKFSFTVFVLLSFFYWLISGFVFFIKKYRFRYFTSSIQRFWKRCFSIFWILEFFLFFCFFYLTIMGSQEPFFMFDNSQIFKTHLFSWKLFILKIFPFCLLIVFTYFLILSIKWNVFSKLNFIIIIITFILFLILWSEFYQFFHIVSFYGNFFWKYDEEENYWFLDNELKRTRISNHFLTICLIAKFWHIVFASIFWFFFIIRNIELNKLRYSMVSANFQNFILVYILSWLYMFPWFKYFFLKLFNNPYYWFYLNNRNYGLRIFWNDLKLIYYSFTSNFNFDSLFSRWYGFKTFSFFYWTTYNSENGFNGFKQHFIKNEIIRSLTTI